MIQSLQILAAILFDQNKRAVDNIKSIMEEEWNGSFVTL